MFDFDSVIDRTTHNGLKWSYLKECCPDRGDILPFWIADTDMAAPPAVVDAIRNRADHPVYGYAGKPDGYYESFRHWMSTRYGVEVDRQWIQFSPGIVPAIATAIRACSNPGDGVVILPPVYGPFSHLIQTNHREVREAPLRVVDGRYEVDLDALETAATGARLLILCTPHNPVGRVWSRPELEAVTEIARRHDLIVIVDEIHADLVFKPNMHVPSMSLSEKLNERLIACWAPSKTFNIAGLQTSYIVIPDESLRAAFMAETEAAGIGTPNCMGIAAAEAAYDRGGPWLDEFLAYLRANYEHLASELAKLAPRLTVYPCEGTFLAWIDFRGAGLVGDVNQVLLDKAGLWLDAGTRFGIGGDGFARLNFGCPRSTLNLAIDRLAAAFGS